MQVTICVCAKTHQAAPRCTVSRETGSTWRRPALRLGWKGRALRLRHQNVRLDCQCAVQRLLDTGRQAPESAVRTAVSNNYLRNSTWSLSVPLPRPSISAASPFAAACRASTSSASMASCVSKQRGGQPKAGTGTASARSLNTSALQWRACPLCAAPPAPPSCEPRAGPAAGTGAAGTFNGAGEPASALSASLGRTLRRQVAAAAAAARLRGGIAVRNPRRNTHFQPTWSLCKSQLQEQPLGGTRCKALMLAHMEKWTQSKKLAKQNVA